MKYRFAALLSVVVMFVLCPKVQATGIFSPYAASHWTPEESDAEFIEKAMDALASRIALARERIAGSELVLVELSSRLSAIQKQMREQHRPNTAAFYEAASMVVRHLPERFQLAQWLDKVELEAINFLEKSHALVVPPLAEDGSNKLQVKAIEKARDDMYFEWHRFVERMSDDISQFFDSRVLQTQENFDYALLKSALPLCDLGQQKVSGLNLVKVDRDSSQFLHDGRNGYFLNYSFLFASISPEWPLQGDPSSSTLLEFENKQKGEVDAEIGHASPYFNLYHDSDAIAAMLDGKSNGKPLEVVLRNMPWYRPFSSLKPRYKARNHQLTTYYGAFKGDWGSTRWEPAASDFHCAKALRDGLTPERPWDRGMTQNEILSELLRAPK